MVQKYIYYLSFLFASFSLLAQNKIVSKEGKLVSVNVPASTLVQGIVKLAGDLSGDADAPRVPELALKAPLNSPSLTGRPVAPTADIGDNSTTIATTAYADRAVTVAVIKDIIPSEIFLNTKIDGKQLYAIKGSFVADGNSSIVSVTVPTGMTGYYSFTTYVGSTTFRKDILSFDIASSANNVVTGFGYFSEVYPAGTYNYVLEYFKN